jgi:HEAT repeat protein
MMLLRPDVSGLISSKDSKTLIRATRHWSAATRAEAAGALGELGTADAAPALILLLNDHQTEVREAAARALGDVGATEAAEAVDPLIEALEALKSPRNDRPGAKEYEFEAIAEALGMLNDPKGVAAVIESATVRFHEGFFSVSRPHVGGLCLSGGAEARAALVRIAAEHYLYETYTLVGVVEALDYLREPRATASLVDILKASVELLRKPGDRHAESLALAAARALGRLETKRAEPLLIDLLLYVHGDITDTQNAVLTIRGEKSPAEFDCEKSSLRLRDYKSRRKQAGQAVSSVAAS